jgi:predicted NAD/FAD-binding protein
VLHTDRTYLPRHPGVQASWNYRLDRCATTDRAVLVSYDLTRLQRLPTTETFLVTLNDDNRIRADRVLARMRYEHPIYTPRSVAARRDLPTLNSTTLAFAGAYHGWGFHEDGVRAGVAAARALGVDW